jgi:hypothetical protein
MWVHGDRILVPALPDGYAILLFTYPWVIIYHIPVLLMDFYPPGSGGASKKILGGLS